MRRSRWIAAAVLGVAALGLTACSNVASPVEATHGQAAKVEAVAGKDVKQVTLTSQAARRLGIATVTVGAPASAPPNSGQGAGGGAAAVVPYSAVLYDPDGTTWVYLVTAPLTYVREKIVVATVGGERGDQAVLSLGPPEGTEIVSVGVIELYGAELGVGE
jgi:hypothetical protein